MSGIEEPVRQNGGTRRGSIWKEITSQVEDHLDLAALELQYESQLLGKRLLAAGIILVLVLTGFLILQIAIIGGLMKAGLSMGVAALVLSAVYFVGALAVGWVLARRDPRLGAPFAATQRELKETLQWIQKIFS